MFFFPLSCLDVYLGYERPAEFGVKGTLTLYWSAWSYGLLGVMACMLSTQATTPSRKLNHDVTQHRPQTWLVRVVCMYLNNSNRKSRTTTIL